MRKNRCGLPGGIGIVKVNNPPVPALVWMPVQVLDASAGFASTT